MWVEFVVGSRPCSEGFSLGSPVFLPPQKQTLQNSNLTRREEPHKPANADVAPSPDIVIYLLPNHWLTRCYHFHYTIYYTLLLYFKNGRVNFFRIIQFW